MQKKTLILMILCLVVIGSTGCSVLEKQPPIDRVVYVTNPLPLPPRPTLPTWTSKDMECLTPDMKQKLRDRDTSRREYSETLEVIIKSTHPK